MTVQQTLMRSIHAVGGLTRGRGMTKNVMSQWINSMPVSAQICDAVETFDNLHSVSSYQHIDYSDARGARDKSDVATLYDWFSKRNPFTLTELVSSSSGVMASSLVNCHLAYEKGTDLLSIFHGMRFSEVKFKRSEMITTMTTISKIKIRGEMKAVDPIVLLKRICVLKKSDAQLKIYSTYELAPYPLSLFNEKGMRKGTKADLYKIFPECESPDFKDVIYVLDGGYLLRKVLWEQKQTYGAICDKYVSYVERHFGSNCVIVFDGYRGTASSSPKIAEQN